MTFITLKKYLNRLMYQNDYLKNYFKICLNFSILIFFHKKKRPQLVVNWGLFYSVLSNISFSMLWLPHEVLFPAYYPAQSASHEGLVYHFDLHERKLKNHLQYVHWYHVRQNGHK